MTTGLLTWGCGCQQNPLRPVGEFTFRCDSHPIALNFCPVCDEPALHWKWTLSTQFVIDPCGHSSSTLTQRMKSGVMP